MSLSGIIRCRRGRAIAGLTVAAAFSVATITAPGVAPVKSAVPLTAWVHPGVGAGFPFGPGFGVGPGVGGPLGGGCFAGVTWFGVGAGCNGVGVGHGWGAGGVGGYPFGWV